MTANIGRRDCFSVNNTNVVHIGFKFPISKKALWCHFETVANKGSHVVLRFERMVGDPMEIEAEWQRGVERAAACL